MPTTDPYHSHATSLESPPRKHFPITPSATPLAIMPRALRVGGGGTLVLRDEAGVEITYTVSSGEVIVFRPVVVDAASTATEIVGWY